jgi:hypothetical protein
MMLDRFGRLMMPECGAIFRNPTGGGLLRAAPGGLAGEQNCCCGTPIPTDCGGVSGGRVCITEFFNAFPTFGDNAAYATFVAGQQLDVTFNSFTGTPPTSTCDCPTLINGTHTISGGVLPGESRWSSATAANLCGSNYSREVTVSIVCNGDGSCTFTATVAFSTVGGGFIRNAVYGDTFTTAKSAFPFTLPLITETLTSSPITCTGVGSTCLVALH